MLYPNEVRHREPIEQQSAPATDFMLFARTEVQQQWLAVLRQAYPGLRIDQIIWKLIQCEVTRITIERTREVTG
mgnify:CR=1 FL=1